MIMDLQQCMSCGHGGWKTHELNNGLCPTCYEIEELDSISLKYRFIVSARFDPYTNKWIGLGVEMGKKGTHETYNVVYNGSCEIEYFDTENEAKQAARNSINFSSPS